MVALCFCIIGICKAQSLSHSVVASSGAHFASANGSLEWTLGEIMTETYQKSNGIFTQGFRQTISVKPESGNAISAYPNPVTDFLYVKTIENGEYLIEFFNIHGQKLINSNSSVNSGIFIHQLDLRDLRAAVYLLRLHNLTTGKRSLIKIVKL